MRKVLGVQGDNEICIPFFAAETERIVRGIGRDFKGCVNVHRFGPPVAQMNLTDDRLFRIVTHLRERD